MAGILYIVSTPIGNLKDVTLRALEVLGQVSVIACEDTRETKKLLSHFNVRGGAELTSYHEHNKVERTRDLLERLGAGDDCALVSDRGTPAVSDPGFFLVRAAVDRGYEVVPVPGASAVLAALVASGLPTDRFLFLGFLPKKAGARTRLLREFAGVGATLVFYCPPQLLERALEDMHDALGNRDAAVVRELTKLHEQVARGKLSELSRVFRERTETVPGEVVVLTAGREPEPGDREEVNALIARALCTGPPRTVKEGVAWLVEHAGMRRNRAYDIVRSYLAGDDHGDDR
jgi:16S rRNA (cytidine1402-2'-O)-methyltransferase